jgi:hypothetical protein
LSCQLKLCQIIFFEQFKNHVRIKKTLSTFTQFYA